MAGRPGIPEPTEEDLTWRSTKAWPSGSGSTWPGPTTSQGALASDATLGAWIEAALAYVRTLPPK
jgi:hypothetical protein